MQFGCWQQKSDWQPSSCSRRAVLSISWCTWLSCRCWIPAATEHDLPATPQPTQQLWAGILSLWFHCSLFWSLARNKYCGSGEEIGWRQRKGRRCEERRGSWSEQDPVLWFEPTQAATKHQAAAHLLLPPSSGMGRRKYEKKLKGWEQRTERAHSSIMVMRKRQTWL